MQDFFGLNSPPKRVEIKPSAPPPTPPVMVGADPNMLLRLADMLKATQAQRAHPAQSPVFTQGPSPTDLPPFQQPGGMMPPFTNTPRPDVVPPAAAPPPAPPAQMPPPAGAPPAPMPPQGASPVIAPGNQQPPPQPESYGPAEPYGQGMMQMPQTGPELEKWRKLMDAMQFARQGA